MRYAMIMAGGSGTRLWPMSRAARPKQLLPLINGRSLLEIAADRLQGLVPQERRYICTGERFRAAIRQALPQFSDAQILGEPTGRDTVNAVGFTAAVLLKQDPDAVFAVLTADHLIEPQDEFARTFNLGFRLVEDDPSRLITFGIKPSFAATGYGYVEQGEPLAGFAGAYKVGRFAEKPDLDTATRYVQSGRFHWNSGMFIFSAATFMNALKRYMPENHEGLTRIAQQWGTPLQTKTLNDMYPALQKISVDFAIMEPACKDSQFTVCTIPMDVSWMDVGSWASYADTLVPDESQNRTNAKIVQLNSQGIVAIADDPRHTIAMIDCQDLIIVRTSDATLVCPRASAEKIKDLVARLDVKLQ